MSRSDSSSTTPDDDPSVNWDLNFRGNLRLWPEPTPALAALANLDGREYDEQDFLSTFPVAVGEKTPTDARRVREPIEALQYAGLACRAGVPRKFVLTDLGRFVFSFLGTIGRECYANDRNISLIAIPWIRGLSQVAEYRAIWQLMRLADSRLTNRELNFAMAHIGKESDVPSIAERVLEVRSGRSSAPLAPLMYPNEAEERKAINPQFLLAGGGGTFIAVDRNDEYRRLREEVLPVLDAALAWPRKTISRSTESSYAVSISRAAAVPHQRVI